MAKSPKNAGKKPKRGGLAKNVTSRNINDVRGSTKDILRVLRSPERQDEAVELIRDYLRESDPSKPGAEPGDVVVAPMVRALATLPVHRRTELIKAAREGLAGSTALDRKLLTMGDNFDPLASPQDIQDALNQIELEGFLEEAKPTQTPEEAGQELAQSPTTFGGKKFYADNRPEKRAAIDRTVPATKEDELTGEVRPLTEGEQQASRDSIIENIVGVPMWQQYKAITDAEKIPTLPPIMPPSARQQALADNPRGLAVGAGISKQARQGVRDDLARIQAMPVDPQMEPFSHLLEQRVGLDADTLNNLKLRVAEEAYRTPPGSDRPMRRALDSLLSEEPVAFGDLPPDVQRVIAQTQMVGPEGGNIFSDEAPAALPSQEMKDNLVARRQAELADIKRRRMAFAENPQAGPASRQSENIDPMTIGTLGLQAPYVPKRRFGMTVDDQLSQSARSEADRVMEAIYRAGMENSGEVGVGDVSDFGKSDVLKQSDMLGRGPGGSIDLDALVPEWRFQYARPGADGNFEWPAQAPSAEFLADQLVGWYGIDNPDEFKRVAVPVLERSIALQYQQGPQTPNAIRAAQTRVVPSSGAKSNSVKFFNSSFGQGYAGRMFDDRFPIQQMEPTEFTQDVRPMSLPPREIPTDPLSGLMDAPTEVNFDELFEQQDAAGPNEVDIDTLFDQQSDPSDFDFFGQSMNKKRSGLLSGLYA